MFKDEIFKIEDSKPIKTENNSANDDDESGLPINEFDSLCKFMSVDYII